MASHLAHISQWKHNRSLLGHIPTDFTDWIVTVSFYAALQAVDALLCFDKNKNVVKHEIRNTILMNTNRYVQIQRHFTPYYGLCRTIRYMANPGGWVSFDKLESEVFRRYLYPIETSVQKLMGVDLELPKIVLMS